MRNKNPYLFRLESFLALGFVSLIVTLVYLKHTFPSTQSNANILGKTSKISFEAQISANIGIAARFTIFGYTSSNALVSLEDIGLKEETRADKAGFFLFTNLKIPKGRKISPCLTAQDSFGRVSSPVCLPPIQNKPGTIGPILLPPTLSVNKNFFFAGDKIIISGQTIPNSTVNLSFFKQKDLPELSLALAKPALALGKRSVEAYSDEKGNFTFVLQTSDAQKMKIVSSARFQESPSPQSTRLTIKIYPWWMMIILFFKAWTEVAKKHVLEIILLLELITVVYLAYRKLFSPSEIAKCRAIVKYKPLLPVKISS